MRSVFINMYLKTNKDYQNSKDLVLILCFKLIVTLNS